MHRKDSMNTAHREAGSDTNLLANPMKSAAALLTLSLASAASYGQSLNVPWSAYAHDPQHTAVSATAAQPLNRIHWSTPVDLNAPSGGGLFIHYGSISVTAGNTVLVPVKTGTGYNPGACAAGDSFEVLAFAGATGTPLYTLCSDYSLPPSNWIPPFGPSLSLGTRLYYPGAGGTVYYRDLVNAANGPNGLPGATGQLVFYGKTIYAAHQSALNAAIQISTPITADRSGDIFFGFIAAPGNDAGVVSGIARIGPSGAGAWVSAASLAGNDPGVAQVALNCAPALSNDQRTVYVAVSGGNEFDTDGYLVSLNATTLAPIAHAQLLDPLSGSGATVSGDSSAAPMVGPDGDVYYGVLEGPCCSSHNDRGWMLHFNSTLSTLKTPGSFGWDNTPSVVPASIVPGYTGTSSYLILTKYNNYEAVGTGDGVNKVAVVDPNGAMQDEYATSPVTVMSEVIAVTGVTSLANLNYPNAVYEWCVNTTAIDPSTKSAIINSEDGVVYRWDFTSNTLLQRLTLTSGRSEAYTPTAIGPDGSVYAISDSILFSVGN
jgi:hypothetical protein